MTPNNIYLFIYFGFGTTPRDAQGLFQALPWEVSADSA